VRRLLLFVALLALTGLTTAFASSFAVETEDVASFTPDVSISVPPSATRFPDLLYVRGAETVPTGTIDLLQPNDKDTPQTQTVVLDTTPPPAGVDTRLKAQSSATMYRSWISPTAPAGGYLLEGEISLFISMQHNAATDRLTAGLFTCPSPAASIPPSTLPPATGLTTDCTEIVQAVSGQQGSGLEVKVDFGSVDVTVPFGSRLVLKIVNLNKASDGTTVSGQSWDVAWGYLPSRQSRLEIAP
jgi:hypothetical protein